MNRYKMVIGTVGVICLVMVLLTLRIKIGAIHEYKEGVNQWNKDLVNLKVAPTPENIFFLQREYEWIVDRDTELRQLLLTKGIPVQRLTPLQFKEELLNSQTKLKQLADIQGCKMQEDLGFPEYTAGEIPEPGEVALLTKHLTVIDVLVNLLLKHKVGEINSIIRSSDVGFEIELQCTLEGLLAVLQDIINAAHVLVVKDLKINKLDESRVNVQMLIEVYEFTG